MIQSFGATLASAEADAFHSYGLGVQHTSIPGSRKGPDASYANISVRAAAIYCNALNYLLEYEEYHTCIGSIAVCSWTKEQGSHSKDIINIISQGYPEQVRDFLKSPLSGSQDSEVLQSDRLYTVAISGRTRAVWSYGTWLDQPLIEAIDHLRQWWGDLQVATFGDNTKLSFRKRSNKKQAYKKSILLMRFIVLPKSRCRNQIVKTHQERKKKAM